MTANATKSPCANKSLLMREEHSSNQARTIRSPNQYLQCQRETATAHGFRSAMPVPASDDVDAAVDSRIKATARTDPTS